MTCAKFFAAARSIDGPPTSIISTISASVAPGCSATRANGYSVTQTRSMSSICCSSRACEVLVELAPREDAGVDARVQRLHAAAEHLGRHRHLLDAW